MKASSQNPQPIECQENKGHEKTSSTSRSLGERFGFSYLRDTIDWFTGKGRKKEKTEGSGDGSNTGDEYQKGYLRFSSMQQFTKNYQLRELIPVPQLVDLHEWQAQSVIPFFHNVNLLYGAISSFCTPSSCPVMNAPNNTIYPWVDERGRKSKCSAPMYVDYVTASIEKLINDESIFPTKYGQSFPPNFEVVLRRIMRQLFHVLAHLYHAHFDAFIQLGIHLYLNGLFAHFVLFSQHFNLIESRELEVLRDLVDRIISDAHVIPEGEVARNNLGELTTSDEDTGDMSSSTLEPVPTVESSTTGSSILVSAPTEMV